VVTPIRAAAVLAVALLFLTFGGGPAQALEAVSLQLKWLHQFQFAGYYAALAHGFYREAGLDVTIREGGENIFVSDEVESGRANFGVCAASILRERAEGRRLVALAAVFQHSPAIVLVTRRSDITSVSELRGRRLMDTPGADEIAAMLRHAGVDYEAMPRVPNSGDPRDLLAGKADAMVAYTTNETYTFEQMAVPFRSFAPASFGVDFYGDVLCTSDAQAGRNPERTEAFRAASLRGWQYALSHREEIADLIYKSYSQAKSPEALLFEAARIAVLANADPDPLGSQSQARWQSIAATYRDLGYLAADTVPPGLIWRGDEDGLASWLRPPRLWSVLLLVAAISAAAPAARRYRKPLRAGVGAALRRLPGADALGRPRLSVIMALLFVCLSIPVLIFILLYNYSRNSDAIVAMLDDAVAEASRVSVQRTEELIGSTEASLRLIAEMAARNPGYFRLEQSSDVLYRALTTEAYIDAVYVSFEDGYHRVVTRIDEDRRRADPQIPAAANWHASYIDDASEGLKRTRHRTFFDVWRHQVGAYDVATDFDVPALPGYQAAKANGTLAVTPPVINPDTGFPILSVRVPIFADGAFIGCTSANITVDVLSRFLALNRASAHSLTFIADRRDGKIIAFPDKEKGVHVAAGKLEVATLATVDDAAVREANRRNRMTSTGHFRFQMPEDGREFVASFAAFPDGLDQAWKVVTLTPTDDFVGTLRATNRLMMMVIIALSTIELVFIYFAAQRLSRPVEDVSRDLQAIQNLDFGKVPVRRSRIQEFAELESAATLLRNSLRSFSSFVPLDVVRQLVRSGIPLAPGVEPRALTLFFSDLENFSGHAETLSPSDLLVQISAYLETVTGAIVAEQGTVDKFIGDGIMAFWGAPAACEDHALRGCRAALRAARRMERVDAAWREEGRPSIRMRIGLNTADQVLVGNIGSSDRLSYTALGDGVNVAARLEGINKQFGTGICISDSTYDAVRELVLARPLKRVRVKGRKSEFMIYELLAFPDSADPELALRDGQELLCALTVRAIQLYEAGDLAAAAAGYRAVLESFPDDPVARVMLAECRVAVAVDVK